MINRVHPLWWLTIGAIALRVLLFLGRGDYVAFDEGWYLLLGRNLASGDGYTLSGLRHVALSPLFPVLAGALDLLIGDAVWAGRLVAAISGGLLVVPCWFLAHRIAGRGAALIAAAFVGAMPSLAPFVVPFWIGWELWVGAEPVLHLLLFGGIALCAHALESRRASIGLAAGVLLGLAYLARPEAVITAALLGCTALALAVARGDLRCSLAPVLLLGVGFALPAAPYWIYLHDALGRWTLTGREVAMVPALPSAGPPHARASAGGRVIEDMLWQDDEAAYVQTLYALDATGTRLANSYWGVQPVLPGPEAPRPQAQRHSQEQPAPPAGAGPLPQAMHDPPGTVTLYARALGRIVPWYVWLLAAVGLLARRQQSYRDEILAGVPVLGTSVLIALAVAVDPRTQLVIVPLIAIYAARGARATGVYIQRRAPRALIRRGFATLLIAGTTAVLLLGTSARRLYLSVAVGSPHHIVGTANRAVGKALGRQLPRGEHVMSWHPALALHADRDWRVLPAAPFTEVVRYANATGTEYLVLSAYYPSPLALDNIPREYLVLHVPPGAAAAEQWQLVLGDDARTHATGHLRPRR